MIRRMFLNPYVQLGFNAIFTAGADLSLKKGATAGESVTWYGLGALVSPWTWLGILSYIIAFACWLYVLRRIPLSIAFGLVTVVQLIVPLGAKFLLGEFISPQRWLGIGCVLCGTILIGKIAAQVEEKK
jgi:drug/metabolite transporter (DMT)-like permease